VKRTIAIGNKSFSFHSLKELLAKASPERSGDLLAGVAASSGEERVAAQMLLADTFLSDFLKDEIIPYDEDEVTRIIFDQHDRIGFQEIVGLTVGEFRNWLLMDETDGATLKRISKGLIPEMVAAVSKLMRNQDLIKVASKIKNVTAFRNTIGLPGRMSVRLQPNDPTDNMKGIAAEIVDGLFYGSGDAVIGINPATDNYKAVTSLIYMLDELREKFEIPTQSCVLTHVTTTIKAIENKVPVDLVFQSIGGTQGVNDSFGVSYSILKEAYEAGLSLNRGTVGQNCMYFETGQGSALSANAHWGVDQQTIETRAYGLARCFDPLLVNTVVGFIGPEYLYNGKQIIRAGLEDHFCGKLLGLPMGVDICYTNHAEADQDDMDTLLTLLGVAGCNFIMGIPGADDIMLNYQSTSFHDGLYIRSVLGLKPAPEFESWLQKMNLFDDKMTPVEMPSSYQFFLNASSL
jgi:ethanolamine ammonia-lyase large subunit